MHTLTSIDQDTLRDLRARDEFFWLDLDGDQIASIDELAGVLDLHELAVEDTRDFEQRPKIDSYDKEMLIVYYGARDDDGCPEPVEVHLHVGRNFVITAHRQGCRRFDDLRAEFNREAPRDSPAVVYKVLDALTDSLIDALETTADVIDDFEAEVFRRPRARDRDRMASVRRSLGTLRRIVVTEREAYGRMVDPIRALPGSDHDIAPYLRDIGDHLARAADEIDSARDSLQGALDNYSNEVQERLTIVATIFLPLTVITGFFGQNFNWMIDHIGSRWAFWGLGVGGMLLSCLLILIWLVRSGLYHLPWR